MSLGAHEESVWQAGIENAHRLADNFCVEKPIMTVSEHAELKRVLPEGTPFPGRWRNSKTPYLVEPMDFMSAYSPIQRDICVKGAQLGLTAASENVVAYYIDLVPSQILYISATEDLLVKWSTKRLDPLIDSYGLRSQIFAQSASKNSKRTGDKTFSKEFFGGALDMASAQSAPSLRSDSKRILIRDEIDGAPKNLSTGEGNWLKVSYARTFGWGARKKILDFSTPGTDLESVIWPEYESGDMRRYYVPCPHCGEMQILEWGHGYGHENPNLGIQWGLVDGKVKQVWYVCEFCNGEILNRHKRGLLNGGDWRPTSISYSDNVTSRQISSLYSPAGMLSWREMVEEYLQAESSSDGMRSFVNLYLGLTYRETGSRPDWENVYELRGHYRAGTVASDKAIFLTASVDTQRGEEKEGGKKERLEMEVCAHGIGYRTWSVEHKVFEGKTDNEYAGAWDDLRKYFAEGNAIYPRKDGVKYPVQLAAVDSGDGQVTGTVYNFTAMMTNFIPSKGMAKLKRRKNEDFDEDMNRAIRRYRLAPLDSGVSLLEINGPFYKQQIYSNLKIPRRDNEPQQANFCEFPSDYGEEWYQQLTAEDMAVNSSGQVSFKKPNHRPNEALDLRVMNLALRDYYLQKIVDHLRADAKSKGCQPSDLEKINSRVALEWLASQIK